MKAVVDYETSVDMEIEDVLKEAYEYFETTYTNDVEEITYR